jgi:ubiquinone/menaquinone biosynthesis C-methylase UbiE
MVWLVTFSILAILGALTYWLFVTTEGLYLGRRMVVWLYDITANKYDGIKEFTFEDEEILVVQPVLAHLQHTNALIVDVATGTGRVPLFLMQDGRFDGRVIGIDASRKMLIHAKKNLIPYRNHVDLVRGFAEVLPLPSTICHLLTCLETLEFIPDQSAALLEMWRVLRPGGHLLITRRRDVEARLFFGRNRSPEQFEAYLVQHGFEKPITHPWQTSYDLVIARKPLGVAK